MSALERELRELVQQELFVERTLAELAAIQRRRAVALTQALAVVGKVETLLEVTIQQRSLAGSVALLSELQRLLEEPPA